MRDGRVYDNSFARRQPVAFRVGGSEVFRGLDEGVIAMAEGERRRLQVPPHLGYASIRGGAPGFEQEALIVDLLLVQVLPQ